ncbi:MAG: RNA polymerase sigma factor [Betaproteobacteria bacterium]|nr:RNA polymerase sigma factor [Betaproteobacteria bacterium]
MQAEESDVELVGRLALGDEPAMRVLYERYKGVVGRLARASGMADPDAREIVQETFLRAWQSASSYRGEGSAGSWLRGIARHRIADHIDAEVKKRSVFVSPNPDPEDNIDATPETIAPEPGPEKLLELARAKQCIEQCLQRLSALHREVLSLRIFGQELKEQEVARLLDVPLGTVKSRTSIALRSLAACVAQCSGMTHA